MQHYKVYDYVNNIISLLSLNNKSEDFKKCNFAILCDKYPIQSSFKNYLAKVIYISIQTKKNTLRLYPNNIKELDMEYIIVSTNARRNLSSKMNEFFINGNTEEQDYNDYKFYNYSIERIDAKTKELVEKLREKYKLDTPSLFIGEHQDLVI